MNNNDNQLPPPLSVEELRNMDFSSVDPEKKIYDELLRVLDETYNDPARDIDVARNAEAGPSNPIEGPVDTILTPFSLSPMTDTAVDSLPELFLAYCTLADSDDIMSDDDRAVPWGSDSDPVPLLTNCALGLSTTFLSRSRR
jgi:hypothetical protein